MNQPAGTSDESAADSWAELDAAFDAWTMEQTRTRGRFFQKDARATLQLSKADLKRLMTTYLQEGRLQDLGHLMGYARTGTAVDVTLADLMEVAEAHVEEGYRAPRGRPATQENRRVDQLSPGQYSDIRTVAHLVAEELTGDRSNWAGVGAVWFSWDPAAGDGAAGAWDILKHVETWVHRRAQAKAEVAGRSWEPSQSEAAVKKYRSALGTLLNLATTKGALPETVRHSQAYNVHAAEWEPLIRTWSERLSQRQNAASGTRRKIRQGLRTLALYATRAGATDPRETDWLAIRDEIRADYEREAITYDIMYWARSVYRTIRGRMIRKPQGSDWSGLQDTRTMIVSSRAIRSVLKDEDAWSDWGLPGLTDGPYGLRRWLAWATATNSRALKAAGLPSREWPRPTPAEERRLRRKPDLFQLTLGVARMRLANFALVAGWLQENREVDWGVSDATVLVDPDNASAFASWCAERNGNEEGKSTLGSAVLFALATLASPYLESVACQHGNLPLADRLRAHSDELKKYALEAQEEERKRIEYIASLWDAGRTGKASGGWLRLIELRDLLIEDAEAAAGGLTIAEQVEAIRAGSFVPVQPEAWAIAIRGAVLIMVLRKIPLRRLTVCRLTTSMWMSVSARRGRGAESGPWEGAIRIEVPKKLMKSKRPFAPWLIRQEHVGDPYHEDILRRDVLELYWMPGGARERVLTIDDKPQFSRYVFPAIASRGGGHGITQEEREERQYRWGAGSLSSHFSSLVLGHAERLGMDRRALEQTWGATAIHVIRLLFGTHWAPVRLLDASRMLQHANIHVTEQKYCARSAEDVDLEIAPED